MSFEELLDTLRIRNLIETNPKIWTHYPNLPITIQRCAKDCNLVTSPVDQEQGPERQVLAWKIRKWTANFRKLIAKWYVKLWITNEYRISGVRVSDAIKPPPVSI